MHGRGKGIKTVNVLFKKIVPSCSMFTDGAMVLGLPWPGQVGGGGRGSGSKVVCCGGVSALRMVGAPNST